MVRPKQKRTVTKPPIMEGFKPFGIPMTEMEPLVLLYEEYESIRLTDYMKYTQEEAAVHMKVSRPTFTRIYENARQTIAKAFVEGKAIFIEGGEYHSDDYWYRCDSCKMVHVSESIMYNCMSCNSNNIRLLNNKIGG
jgi:predicted DNA-binding protein (UPF0251 family)